MQLGARVSAAAGDRLVRGLLRLQRRLLGARLEVHRDARGRATPYLVVGEPRDGTLVWLHGFADRVDTFLPVAARLRSRFRIVIPAMPGFHDGWRDEREAHGFDAYGRWMLEVLDAIVPGRFHIMGNSLGGSTALLVAAARPARVASLTLVSAGVEVDGVRWIGEEIGRGHNLFEVRDRAGHRRFLARVMRRPPRVLRVLESHLVHEGRKVADWYVRVMGDMSAGERVRITTAAPGLVEVAAIRTPTLVVWGEHDSLFPLATGERLADTLPDAELRVLRGVGHVPHVESPGRLAAAFLDFVDARGLARGRPTSPT